MSLFVEELCTRTSLRRVREKQIRGEFWFLEYPGEKAVSRMFVTKHCGVFDCRKTIGLLKSRELLA